MWLETIIWNLQHWWTDSKKTPDVAHVVQAITDIRATRSLFEILYIDAFDSFAAFAAPPDKRDEQLSREAVLSVANGVASVPLRPVFCKQLEKKPECRVLVQSLNGSGIRNVSYLKTLLLNFLSFLPIPFDRLIYEMHLCDLLIAVCIDLLDDPQFKWRPQLQNSVFSAFVRKRHLVF